MKNIISLFRYIKEVRIMRPVVEPIRDLEKIDEIFSYLKEKNIRDYIIAKIQFNTVLLITDILKLKVKDFMTEDLKIKDFLYVRNRKIVINEPLSEAIEEYVKIKNLSLNNYICASQKDSSKPITRTQAHRIFQNVGQALNIDNFNSHSLRKSWGYFAYIKTNNIHTIMEIYNHSCPKVTLEYIGIATEKEKNEILSKDEMFNKIQF